MSRRIGVIVLVGAIGIAAASVIGSPGQAVSEVRLTAAGDYGASSATAAVLGEIASIDPDAHLALGDLAYGYASNEYEWCDFVTQRVGDGFPFQLISGNHESNDNNDGDINDFSSCLPNQVPGVVGTYGRQYAMDFPQNAPLVRVIQASPNLTFEDGRLSYSAGDANWTWVSDAIDAGRAKGARWIIVTSHYPCLTAGTNGCPAVRDFYDLLVDKRVDLVLHGHEHSYARTHQLASGVAGCASIAIGSTDADCIADQDDAYGAGYGTVFATVGTGGIELRDINPADNEAGYFAAWSGANSTPSHGVLDLSITEDQLGASFVDATGGGFSDAFTITTGLPAPTTTTTTVPPTPTTTTVPPPPTTVPPPPTTVPPPPTTVPPPPTTTTTTTVPPATTTTTTIPGVPPLATDTFSRESNSGWGVSDSGALWSSSSASAFSVSDGVGRLSSPSGSSRSISLASDPSANTDLALTLSVDKVGSGSGHYISVIPRSVGGSDYRAVVRYQSSGRLTVRLDRRFSTIASEVVVPGVTATAGTKLRVRVQAIGTSPTTVRVKVWEEGTPEPAAWARSVTDDTAALQQPGSVGVYAYLSSRANNAPIVISFDDLLVTVPTGA